ncbi:hypothetical protein B0A81_02590 [Flavobacterium plurextorum]|uniref:Lysozyme n=1 Tax=Flavobacterium plurextorum TaxID=1114867 RepID=A0ABX4CYZ2_9FLAO|nr:hypothetical protein [Flavobacterium plurextorum]OXB10870.1 hypothetical protein B0A81_02590 [Flavobacterium plurextorum]
MKTRKVNFSELENNMKREEKMHILGGGANTLDQLGPSDDTDFDYSSGGGFGMTGFGQGPFVSGSANNFSQLGSYGSSSYNNSSYSGSSYGSGSGNNNNNNYYSGWISDTNSLVTANPNDIYRFLNFVTDGIATNPQFSWNTISAFLSNELTPLGRTLNDSAYGAILLNNVTVINNYKGPSTIPQGVVYNNGILELDYSYYNSGTTNNGGGSYGATQSRTSAILSAFTRDQVVNGFNKIDFSGMILDPIQDWDPIKKEYDYNNPFQPNMKINVEGAIAIALYEQLSLSVYDNDGSINGTATIGFGHKLHPGLITSTDPKTITFDQAISYFAQDIIKTENVLNQKIENMDLTGMFNRSQYFALFDMAYNGGNSSDSILTAVLNGMKSGGVEMANKVIEDAYRNADPKKGIMERRYFEAQAFIYGRSLTPEESKTELINLGLK